LDEGNKVGSVKSEGQNQARQASDREERARRLIVGLMGTYVKFRIPPRALAQNIAAGLVIGLFGCGGVADRGGVGAGGLDGADE